MSKTSNNPSLESIKPLVKEALEALFADESDEGFAIPDDAIVGAFKDKVTQLQSRVDHLLDEIMKLNERLDKMDRK